MKRSWLVSGIFVALLLITSTFILAFYFKVDTGNFLTSEELAQPSLIESTQAVLYFSTTADQDINHDGLSYAVFVDTDGKAKLWEMQGLELGTVFAADDTIFLEERDKVHIIGGESVESVDMPIDEHTGEVTGFNVKDGLFYSVYNSGFTEDGGYQSNIRIGNAGEFDTIHIPYYLFSSGMTDTELLMVTDDGESLELTLRRMPLQRNMEIEEIASLGVGDSKIGLSSIVYAEGYYLIVMCDLEKKEINITRVNEKSRKVDVITVYSYENDEDFQVRIPYNIRNSAEVVDGTLYYVDGIGDVYSFDIEGVSTGKKFTLKGASDGAMKMSEQTYFKDGKLHFYRHHRDSKTYSLDTYELKTGMLINELPITGIDKMYKLAHKKSKRLSAYDFIVLH